MSGNWTRGVLLVWVASSAAASPAGDAEGISIAVLGIARDSASAQQAIDVGYLVRSSFGRNPRYSVVDLEAFLSGDAPPAARASLSSGLAKLERGRQMYDAFELEPALATLNDAVVQMERGVGALEDVTPMLQALQLLGVCYALSTDPEKARASFARALVIDRRAQLEAGNVPPSALELYEEARRSVEQLPQGSLSVYGNPAAAEVFVDGTYRGASPLTIDRLPAGRHVVRVYRPGYDSYGQVVQLSADQEQTLQASLTPTAQAAQLEDLGRRAGLEAAQDGVGPATSQLGAWLKVDQLFLVLVTAHGQDVTLHAAHYDAAAGQRLHAATRTFAYGTQGFRSNIEDFVVQEFRQAQLGVSAEASTGNQLKSSYAPERVSRGVHPGYVWGGVSTALSVVGLAVGVGFTVPAVNINNKLAKIPQIETERSEELRAEGQLDFGVATAGYAVCLVAAGTAAGLFILAANEQETIETILETPGAGEGAP